MKYRLLVLSVFLILLCSSCKINSELSNETSAIIEAIDTAASPQPELTEAVATAQLTEHETTKAPTVLEPIEGSRRFVTISDAYTQAFCVSDDFVFVSHSASKGGNKNDYILYKYDRFTGELISQGSTHLNHANGMTYNSRTNEIIVTALDGNGTSTTSIGTQDFCLFVVDPDTLKIKRIVNLVNIILKINKDSVGISAVAYNEITDNYYVLTRYPERRIVTLTGDFEYVSDFPILFRSDPYLHGDICCDGEYLYTTAWIRSGLENVVDIYTLEGELIETKEVNGLTHIEGIDRRNGRFYVNFIDFNVSPVAAVVCEMDKLGRVK